MRNIFVSYRREDTADVTGRIYDHLKTSYGEEHLFKDVDSIPSGSDFREEITSAVQGCDVLLAVIGSDWLKASSEAGARRIDDPHDYVRMEVSSALDRKIPVIPVLVNGAGMPTEKDLPEPLRQLAFQNAIPVRRDPDFQEDMKRLCGDIDQFLNIPFWRRHLRPLAAIAAAVVFLLLGIVIFSRPNSHPPSPLVDKLTFINNVTVIVQEYEKYQGRPIAQDLKEQIDRAVATALEGNHQKSVKLLEQIAAKAPLPSIFTNLGVEYAKLNNLEAAKSAFDKAIEKDPNNTAARENRKLVAAIPYDNLVKKAVTVEPSSVTAILIDRFEISPEGVKEIQVVKKGGATGRYYYDVEYRLKPENATIVAPGAYDIVIESTGGGTFHLINGLEVKESQVVRINPNILLGAIMVEPLTRKGYPVIKEIKVLETGTTGKRDIHQQATKLGVPLPIVPGRYDIVGVTADGDRFTLQTNLEVRAGEVGTFHTDRDVAAIVVHAPKIAVAVDEIRILAAGMKELAKTTKFGRVLIVPAGGAYDIVVQQPGSNPTTMKSNVSPKNGELIELNKN